MYSGSDNEAIWSPDDLRQGFDPMFEAEGQFVSDEMITGSFNGAWAGATSDEPMQPLRLAGDFYNEPDNVHRGVDLADVAFGGLYTGEEDLFNPGALHNFEVKKDLQEPVQFSDGFPAEVPSCGCFSTSVILDAKRVSAAEAATSVYDFLRAKVSTSICKVRPAKFAIKAEVFPETAGVSCLLKVRIYSSPGPQLVVECRRCRGDTVLFGHTFQEAANHLRLRFQDACCGHAPAPLSALAKGFPPQGAEELAVQPLVDMALSDGDLELQAEAASALAALMSTAAGNAMCMCAILAGLQEVLAKLCNSGLEIAYPAARLISQLARNPGENSMAEQLALAAVRAAVTEQTDDIVRRELAEAVRAVAAQCNNQKAVGISKDKMRIALLEALDKPFLAHKSSVTHCLREVLGTLEDTGQQTA
mmetsp:Transcript_60988/g.108407  ORF Transcript_60988/g.108407 Transcript_60988/m.108407 type:complete len:418 (+) Transcript_60988:183-1436(+)|eukprot:CAMPEP_0197657612 /NCGR_PEP_ID=MMETSP1338-20131121/44735_1 /TAXON_ID=43686 ORGANISM="Pelagodinium beii, Strain RCC1491" /NCGR_SAMPLE_ID=MMETSP1338 /ASSEMBLY_ACC=CAM_ASM_000754 /LENGTH=417 /DNA_ID=CAMNT_0043234025 /DNA_START=176 /DNA_END=1429 /DNA_ORIENTATION=-